MLNRQSMGIPPGNIRGIISLNGFVTDDEIFQDFIQGMADMDIAVCIRRSVMQNKLRPSLSSLLHLMINVDLIPPFLNFRFSIGKFPRMGKSVFGRFKVWR